MRVLMQQTTRQNSRLYPLDRPPGQCCLLSSSSSARGAPVDYTSARVLNTLWKDEAFNPFEVLHGVVPRERLRSLVPQSQQCRRD